MASKLLLINPNSSQVITDGIKSVLDSLPTSISVSLSYFTCPSSGPPSINDHVTSILSAAESYQALQPLIPDYNGFLVCCFSDHPLVYMLRETTDKPVVGILQAAVVHSLLLGKKFGIITSGHGWIIDLTAAVREFLGANASDRFAGVCATGLGVLELKEANREVVGERVREVAADVIRLGADVVILGCAGMTGMELEISRYAAEAGLGPVTVVDGIRAGVRVLAGLVPPCMKPVNILLCPDNDCYRITETLLQHVQNGIG